MSEVLKSTHQLLLCYMHSPHVPLFSDLSRCPFWHPVSTRKGPARCAEHGIFLHILSYTVSFRNPKALFSAAWSEMQAVECLPDRFLDSRACGLISFNLFEVGLMIGNSDCSKIRISKGHIEAGGHSTEMLVYIDVIHANTEEGIMLELISSVLCNLSSRQETRPHLHGTACF